MVVSIAFIFLQLTFLSSYICSGRSSDPGSHCWSLAKNCTDARIRRDGGVKEVRTVFQDTLFHYCLDLTGCQSGKQQICHSVGKTEKEYTEPILRKRLIRQCATWKISVRYARSGDTLGHYVFIRHST